MQTAAASTCNMSAMKCMQTAPWLCVRRHTKSRRPQCPAGLPVLRQCASTSPSPLAGVPRAAAGCTGGSCGLQGGPTGGAGTSSSTGQLRHRLVREGPCHPACGRELGGCLWCLLQTNSRAMPSWPIHLISTDVTLIDALDHRYRSCCQHE